MPLPLVHISAMRHVADSLSTGPYQPVAKPQWSGENMVELGELLNKYPNFASLGAIGPDLMAFIPDFKDINGIPTSSVIKKILDFLEYVSDTFDPFISKWEHYLGPISEDNAEEMSRLTGGLSETVGDIAGELGSISTTLIEDLFTMSYDWWGLFSLGSNVGYDEQAYTWLDMLHYRKTASFARALWKNTSGLEDMKKQAQAYSLGYITHVATDTTGHPFVNAISGGPFRLHWQRHHLIENHMEAYWYLHEHSGEQYPQITESALYYDIAFKESGEIKMRPTYPPGKSLRENWERRRKLDTDSDLPDVIADVLWNTMQEIYYTDDKEHKHHPRILRDNDGCPTKEMISQAYSLLFSYLKHTTVDGFNHEPPEPPDVYPNLNFPTIGDPSEEPPGEDDNSFWDDVLKVALSIIAIIAYIVEVAIYLASLPWAVLADTVTYPLRLGLYYALELPLYHIIKAFRYILVMTGYLLPMKEEIASGLVHIGAPDTDVFGQVLNQIGDTFGGLPVPDETKEEEPVLPGVFRDPAYPHQIPEIEILGKRIQAEHFHPWNYPAGIRTEVCSTTASPYNIGAGVEVLFGDINSDPSIRDRLEKANSPEEADTIGLDITPDRHLGDAVSFSKYLIWLESRTSNSEDKVVEWNLDADRGYGYHCWDWNRNSKIEVPDPEKNNFQAPCTWPQQSNPDQGTWNPDIPLQLHWSDLEDPGCSDKNSPPPDPINIARSDIKNADIIKKRNLPWTV